MSGKVKSDGCTCRPVEQFAQHRGQVKGFQAWTWVELYAHKEGPVERGEIDIIKKNKIQKEAERGEIGLC